MRATQVLFRSRRLPEVGELVGGIDALQCRLLHTIAIASAVSFKPYMDPPALSRGSRMNQHASGQMQSYIRIWTPPDLQAEN